MGGNVLWGEKKYVFYRRLISGNVTEIKFNFYEYLIVIGLTSEYLRFEFYYKTDLRLHVMVLPSGFRLFYSTKKYRQSIHGPGSMEYFFPKRWISRHV